MNDLAGGGGSEISGAPGVRPLRRRFPRRRKLTDEERERRRLRIRRRGRRAYIRSAYSLPTLATLGNAICGFASIYCSAMEARTESRDPWTLFFVNHHFLAAAYLVFIAMLFDALDGRLARFTRHTTDFGGQLDSLADVVSFGIAPAVLALELFHAWYPDVPPVISRTAWAIGALYMSCALLRLARFNVSNEHGEQHHFSFLGLPSPGAAAVVSAFVLVQQDLAEQREKFGWFSHPALAGASSVFAALLPPLVLIAGLLMVSAIRYPHLVNRYLRGRRSIGRLLLALVLLLMLVVVHRYTLCAATLVYTFWGPLGWGLARLRRRGLAGTGAGNA